MANLKKISGTKQIIGPPILRNQNIVVLLYMPSVVPNDCGCREKDTYGTELINWVAKQIPILSIESRNDILFRCLVSIISFAETR